jgi:hypothetical protein
VRQAARVWEMKCQSVRFLFCIDKAKFSAERIVEEQGCSCPLLVGELKCTFTGVWRSFALSDECVSGGLYPSLLMACGPCGRRLLQNNHSEFCLFFFFFFPVEITLLLTRITVAPLKWKGLDVALSPCNFHFNGTA